MSRGLKIREEVPSIVLSEMLGDVGISNVSLLNLGKVPDIYLLVGGVRVIIETKEQGHRAELDRQLKQRLELDLCEVAIGLEYPTDLVEGTLAPPTPQNVRKKLLNIFLVSRSYAQGGAEPRLLFEDIRTKVAELPELLARAASEALPDQDLEKAIAMVRDSVEMFSDSISTLPKAKVISENIKKELDVGE